MKQLKDFLEEVGLRDNPFGRFSADTDENLPYYFVRSAHFANVLGNPQETIPTVYFAQRGKGKTATARMVEFLLTADTAKDFYGPVLVVNFNSQCFDALLLEVDDQLEKLNRRHYRTKILERVVQTLNQEIEGYLKKFNLSLTLLTDYNQFSSLNELGLYLHKQGLNVVYILIDGVDEMQVTAHQPLKVAELVLPLLADLQTLKSSYVAFKFFLPLEAKDILEKSGQVRFDHFKSVGVVWEWTEQELRELIKRRLEYYSLNEPISSLGMLSDVPGIDTTICREAKGSPRNLIRLCNDLINEHLREDNAELIRSTALKRTLDNFKAYLETETNFKSVQPVEETPASSADVPPLPIQIPRNRTRNKIRFSTQDAPYLLRVLGEDVYIGDNLLSKGPAGIQLKVLKELYKSRGKTCSKASLIDNAFDEDEEVEPQQLDTAVKRLRNKLPNPPDNPVSEEHFYIKTAHGKGYRLENYGEPNDLEE